VNVGGAFSYKHFLELKGNIISNEKGLCRVALDNGEEGNFYENELDYVND
jgi:hypothetical protein